MASANPANPYAAQLGARDAREVIAETPHRLRVLAGSLGASGLERSLAPGKWPARAILAHLADCEIAFGFRLRQAVAEPHHVIQPFAQGAWAKPYGSLSAEEALETFAALRRWNVAFLAALPRPTFAKKVTHPERGEMTIQTIVETMAGHDSNHVKQLEKIAAAR